jgi:hypothetical protein
MLIFILYLPERGSVTQGNKPEHEKDAEDSKHSASSGHGEMMVNHFSMNPNGTKTYDTSKWESKSVVRISAYSDDKLEDLQHKRQQSGVLYGKPVTSTELLDWPSRDNGDQQQRGQNQGAAGFAYTSGAKSHEVLAYPGSSEKKTTYSSLAGTVTDYKSKTHSGDNYWRLEVDPNPPRREPQNNYHPQYHQAQGYPNYDKPTPSYQSRPFQGYQGGWAPVPTYQPAYHYHDGYQQQQQTVASEEKYFDKAVGYANTKFASELDHFVDKHKIKFEEEDKTYPEKQMLSEEEEKMQAGGEEIGGGGEKDKLGAVMAVMSTDSSGSGELCIISNNLFASNLEFLTMHHFLQS